MWDRGDEPEGNLRTPAQGQQDIMGWLERLETASYVPDPDQFCSDLGRLGFDVMSPRKEGLFLRIRALKNAMTPAPASTLRFRQHDASGM